MGRVYIRKRRKIKRQFNRILVRERNMCFVNVSQFRGTHMIRIKERNQVHTKKILKQRFDLDDIKLCFVSQ